MWGVQKVKTRQFRLERFQLQRPNQLRLFFFFFFFYSGDKLFFPLKLTQYSFLGFFAIKRAWISIRLKSAKKERVEREREREIGCEKMSRKRIGFIVLVFFFYLSADFLPCFSAAKQQPPAKKKSARPNRIGTSSIFPIQGNVYPLGYVFGYFFFCGDFCDQFTFIY